MIILEAVIIARSNFLLPEVVHFPVGFVFVEIYIILGQIGGLGGSRIL